MTDIKQTIFIYALRIPAVLIALTVHEVCHGLAAYRLGDTTARDMGRLSLNPLRHLTLTGCICMLFFGFGFAKPVPINTRQFRHPKRDMAITALAGPLSNLMLALLGVLAEAILEAVIRSNGVLVAVQDFRYWIIYVSYNFVYVFYMLNIGLAVFNMIPVPPLDGSRIVLTFLPQKLYFGIMKYEQYIVFVMFAAIWLGFLDKPLSIAISAVSDALHSIVYLIPFLG